jgi:serine/threonine protein kinase
MSEQVQRGVLMALAVEGVVPVVGGCAGALAGGPDGGMVGGVVGLAVGQAVEKVINFFGGRIVERWGDWFRRQPPAVREQALAELASMPAEEARDVAQSLLDRLVLEPISQADRDVAVSYLSLLPGALDRALPRDVRNGARSLPPTVSAEEPLQLLSLLPVSLPPYPIGGEVPGTPYRLEALLGAGGFGAVYRASTRSLQHLPLAIKFCLDPALSLALNRERSNLERLMKAGGENWSPRVVRLYGYDLDHKTPYLVYEYVTGGDLIRHLAERRERMGRPLNTQEVFELMVQVAEALAFAHESGLVHRDLKPANVLVEGGVLKLADFGLGGVAAARAAQVSRIGATTVDQLTIADQASLFRGAGTPLYMAPEQRRGQAPDPRHDLFSMGVMWYQLLVGDVSRELHPGWAKELTLRHGVPRHHIDLIERCVGWFDERPRNAGELLALMQEKPAPAAPALPASPPPAEATQQVKSAETGKAAAVATGMAKPAEGLREQLLHSLLRRLGEAHQAAEEHEQKVASSLMGLPIGVGMVTFFALLEGAHLPAAVCVILALAAAGVIGGGLILVQLGRRGEAREKLALAVRTLNTEFPEVVRGWGGESILQNADLVRQLLGDLGLAPAPIKEPKAKEEPVAMPDLDAVGRKKLLEELRPLAERQAEADQLNQRRPVPLAVALLIGLVAGALAGWGFGEMLDSFEGPVRIAYPGFTEHYTARNMKLTQERWILEARTMLTACVAWGVGVGLVVCALIVWLLWRWNWYRQQLLLGGVLGGLVGALAGVGVGLLHHGLASPYRIVYQGGEEKYFSAAGFPMDFPRYFLEQRQANAASVLLGVITGVLLELVVVFLVQWLYSRKVARARRGLIEGVKQLAERFPQVVASRGGAEALLAPGQLAVLQHGLAEPA